MVPFLRGVKSLSDVTVPAVSSRGSLGCRCSEKRKESPVFLRRASMVPYPNYLAGKGWLEATEPRGEVGAAGSFSLRSAPRSAAQVGMVAGRDLAAAGLREAGGSCFPAKPFPKKR